MFRSHAMTAGLAASALLAAAAAAPAAVVLQDDFSSYADNAAVQAAWNGSGITLNNAYTPDIRFSNTDWSLSGTPQEITLPSTAGFVNGVIWRPLSSTVTNDFSLRFKLISTTYSRTHKIAIMDASGLNGYAIAWNVQNVNQFTGKGAIAVYEYINAAVGTSTPAADVRLTASNLNTGHWATGAEFTYEGTVATYQGIVNPVMADIELKWFKNEELASSPGVKGVFRLYVDNVLKAEFADNSVSSFSRLYITGATHGVFDDIVVDAVPEPALLAPALIGGFMLRRTRQTHQA